MKRGVEKEDLVVPTRLKMTNKEIINQAFSLLRNKINSYYCINPYGREEKKEYSELLLNKINRLEKEILNKEEIDRGENGF